MPQSLQAFRLCFYVIDNCSSGKPSVRYDIEGTGRYVLERYDREIKADHEAFVRRQFPVGAQPVVAPPGSKAVSRISAN